MTEQLPQDFIDALHRLESDGDIDAIAGLFAEESTCGNITATEEHAGPDGARTFWSQDRALFDEVHSEFREVVVDDDHAALEWRRTGTGRSGDAVDYDGVSVLSFADGRITRFKAYFDPKRVGRRAL